VIFVIIPVHNRVKNTLACIRSICLQVVSESLEIIVVDDGSTDSTKRDIEVEFPHVTLLLGDGNLFWTGAVSLGVDYALRHSLYDNDWVILMNNDVEISDAHLFEGLIGFAMKQGRGALVSPLSLSQFDRNKTITSGTVVRSWFFNLTSHVFNGVPYDNINALTPIPVDFMTARCLLHPIRVFREIGNYDALRFPHYGGDDEFSHRAKSNGYKLFVLPEYTVYLDDTKPNKIKNGVFSSFIVCLFDIRSSINLRDKFIFSFYIPPWYARMTYFLSAFLKTLIGCVKL